MNVIGFDDGPFAREHRGDVLLVGAVCSRTRLDGVVSARIRRDGSNATRTMIELVARGPFHGVRAVLLKGIAVGGFNVVDIHALAGALNVPVLVVMRRPPDMDAIRRALFSDAPAVRPAVRGAAKKWRLIEEAGAIEPLGAARVATGLRVGGPRLWVQRAGLTKDAAKKLVEATTLHGHVPEPLRMAHLIAGGIARRDRYGWSRGRA